MIRVRLGLIALNHTHRLRKWRFPKRRVPATGLDAFGSGFRVHVSATSGQNDLAEGQARHRGHHRRLVPTAEVSAVEILLPGQCRRCGERLPQTLRNVTAQGEPRRHQVREIPPIEPHITEYQFPNLVCGYCGKTTREPLPNEIAGHFGRQLGALMGSNRA